MTSDTYLQVATHQFLHQINHSYKCLEVPHQENSFSSKFSVSGRRVIQAINHFDLRGFTKTSAHLQRLANSKNHKEHIPKKDLDNSEDEETNPPAEENEESAAEDESVQSDEEVEHNIAKISFNYQVHSKALIALLAKTESERKLKRY